MIIQTTSDFNLDNITLKQHSSKFNRNIWHILYKHDGQYVPLCLKQTTFEEDIWLVKERIEKKVQEDVKAKFEEKNGKKYDESTYNSGVAYFEVHGFIVYQGVEVFSKKDSCDIM